MSHITAYSSLYAQMLPFLPGYDETLVAHTLKRIGREFAEKTNAFREDLIPLAVVDYQRDYTLSHNYDAAIHRIWWVKVNNALMNQGAYSLWKEAILR